MEAFWGRPRGSVDGAGEEEAVRAKKKVCESEPKRLTTHVSRVAGSGLGDATLKLKFETL